MEFPPKDRLRESSSCVIVLTRSVEDECRESRREAERGKLVGSDRAFPMKQKSVLASSAQPEPHGRVLKRTGCKSDRGLLSCPRESEPLQQNRLRKSGRRKEEQRRDKRRYESANQSWISSEQPFVEYDATTVYFRCV